MSVQRRFYSRPLWFGLTPPPSPPTRNGLLLRSSAHRKKTKQNYLSISHPADIPSFPLSQRGCYDFCHYYHTVRSPPLMSRALRESHQYALTRANAPTHLCVVPFRGYVPNKVNKTRKTNEQL